MSGKLVIAAALVKHCCHFFHVNPLKLVKNILAQISTFSISFLQKKLEILLILICLVVDETHLGSIIHS
jgi:hypothetical protein